MRHKQRLLCALLARPSLLAIAGLALLAGCRDGRIATYPVVGSVLIDGRPADGAMLIFCPTTSVDGEAMRERPFGTTEADGKFELMTFEPGDGAPAGQYKVLIQWPTPVPAGGDRGRGSGNGQDRLRGKYFNLEKSTLMVDVAESTNDLPPFELSSK